MTAGYPTSSNRRRPRYFAIAAAGIFGGGLAICTSALAQSINYAHDAGSATNPQQTVVTGRWNDKSLPAEDRAKAALAVMTHEEKIAIINAAPLGVPRLGIAPVTENDASLGVANIGNFRKGDVATALPASLLLGASWNPEIAFRGGAMIGSEARSKGIGILLGGGANLIRDPRAGRNFEYISEDPLLTGILAGNAIAGIQSNHIISTLKHFALNNQETGRAVYSVEMSEKDMRETDLLGFEIANEIGHPWSVMCSYNRVNGVYACENRFLLLTVLKHDWNFKGFVMSDWGAVHSVASLVNGLDQESGGNIDTKQFFKKELEMKLADGSVSPSAVDNAAERILMSLFSAGLVDAPPVRTADIDYDGHAQIAQRQAEEGIVLLQNNQKILPISTATKRIAVIGGHADLGVLSGGGSSQVVPVGGLKLEIPHKGPIRRSYGGTPPVEGLKSAFPNAEITYLDGKDVQAAVALAQNSDVTIVFAEKWSNESDDSADMSLGEGQDHLIEAVARANPKTIVVLETGNPVLMPWQDKVAGIVEAWYPGQRGGTAIARILSGEVNPSGHLPVTWPASIEQLPLQKLPGSDVPPATPEVRKAFGYGADRVPFHFSYPEGNNIGYRWYEHTMAKPLFPFGYGLSYTTFKHDQLKVEAGKEIKVTFRTSNLGSRTGADVPQVYIRTAGMPRRLIGWKKIALTPGATQSATIVVDPRTFAEFDASKKVWVVRPGKYQIEVGSDVEAMDLKKSVYIGSAEVQP